MTFKNKTKKIFGLKSDGQRKIKERSNIVQYDDMGYPLRLCIMDDGKQVWLDSYNEDADLVCKWKFMGDKQ